MCRVGPDEALVRLIEQLGRHHPGGGTSGFKGAAQGRPPRRRLDNPPAQQTAAHLSIASPKHRPALAAIPANSGLDEAGLHCFTSTAINLRRNYVFFVPEVNWSDPTFPDTFLEATMVV